jgi:hypothetical protein
VCGWLVGGEVVGGEGCVVGEEVWWRGGLFDDSCWFGLFVVTSWLRVDETREE